MKRYLEIRRGEEKKRKTRYCEKETLVVRRGMTIRKIQHRSRVAEILFMHLPQILVCIMVGNKLKRFRICKQRILKLLHEAGR